MTLSAQAFAEILQALRRPLGGGGVEHRRATRMPVEARVPVTLLTHPRAPLTLCGLARDVSHSGIGILLQADAAPGAQIIVHLPRHGHDPMLLLCVVKVCVEAADGIYKMGAEYARELSSSDLHRLRASGEQIERIRRSILSTT